MVMKQGIQEAVAENRKTNNVVERGNGKEKSSLSIEISILAEQPIVGPWDTCFK